jgi:hypothetical protein
MRKNRRLDEPDDLLAVRKLSDKGDSAHDGGLIHSGAVNITTQEHADPSHRSEPDQIAQLFQHLMSPPGWPAIPTDYHEQPVTTSNENEFQRLLGAHLQSRENLTYGQAGRPTR